MRGKEATTTPSTLDKMTSPDTEILSNFKTVPKKPIIGDASTIQLNSVNPKKQRNVCYILSGSIFQVVDCQRRSQGFSSAFNPHLTTGCRQETAANLLNSHRPDTLQLCPFFLISLVMPLAPLTWSRYEGILIRKVHDATLAIARTPTSSREPIECTRKLSRKEKSNCLVRNGCICFSGTNRS
nr:hypothetical protein HmN_000944000 [Hymenolepis microstoma]